MANPGNDLERPPPMAWLPIVAIGGLALFGAWSLFSFILGTFFTILKLGVIVAVIGGVAFVLMKGYKGPPE